MLIPMRRERSLPSDIMINATEGDGRHRKTTEGHGISSAAIVIWSDKRCLFLKMKYD